MSETPIDLLCNHCSSTFATFLRELAEKNAKVVCPNCGTEHDGKPAMDDKAIAGSKKPQ